MMNQVNVCRWLPVCRKTGNRRIQICDTVYELVKCQQGFRLIKPDETVYTLDLTWGCGVWVCDCPDARHRSLSKCKHVRAVRALLKAQPF